MLLGDARTAGRPAVAEVARVGKDDIGEYHLERDRREQPVERCVRADAVESSSAVRS